MEILRALEHGELDVPAALENAPAHSQYLAPELVPQVGPVRVLLGEYGHGIGGPTASSTGNVEGDSRWRERPEVRDYLIDRFAVIGTPEGSSRPSRTASARAIRSSSSMNTSSSPRACSTA
mgnify:CR=1 FL=1